MTLVALCASHQRENLTLLDRLLKTIQVQTIPIQLYLSISWEDSVLEQDINDLLQKFNSVYKQRVRMQQFQHYSRH